MSKIVCANLKMNMLLEETIDYINKIKHLKTSDLVIFPTSIYADYFIKNNYITGLQNIYSKTKGAYTGEISPTQAKSMGISYTLIGHSERREYFKESNEEVNAKIKEALNYDLKVIMCIGEKGIERDNNQTKQVLEKQIKEGLKDIIDLKNVIIAYEPVWAIGSNVTPSNDDIKEASEFIKKTVLKENNYQNIPVLYGGSINDKNIELLNQIDNIEGYLVGGASLDYDKLKRILEVAVS